MQSIIAVIVDFDPTPPGDYISDDPDFEPQSPNIPGRLSDLSTFATE
jgi:hypothetical protein